MWNKSCIPFVSQKRNLKLVGVVNHVFDRRGSQFYDFNEKIFTRQFLWQKFIEIHQIFTKLWCCVPFGTLRGKDSSATHTSSRSTETLLTVMSPAVTLEEFLVSGKRLWRIHQSGTYPTIQFSMLKSQGKWESCLTARHLPEWSASSRSRPDEWAFGRYHASSPRTHSHGCGCGRHVPPGAGSSRWL